MKKEKKLKINDKFYCQTELDPFYSFSKRLTINKFVLCKSGESEHICYKNNFSYFSSKKGVICMMKNFYINPINWKEDGYIYNGPVNKKTRGRPLIKKGFFNMKCKIRNNISNFNTIYNNYFKSWKYYRHNKDIINNHKDLKEELSPGKIIFILSRNQDSPNLFHGGSEFISAFSLMNLLNLNPENIQVLFLESMKFNNDPFFNLYKNIISRGGEPIHIRQLNKNIKYHISNAINIPINWDSPCFTVCGIPKCKNKTITYDYLYNSIFKYMNITNFIDNINYDKEIFYYPESFKNRKLPSYTKYLTIQWRKPWPKNRKGQYRLLGNGPEIVEKLDKLIKKNILIRLVDTANLSIEKQISLMQKTNYFLGIHGAGLFLSIFLPKNSIVHEIKIKKVMNNLQIIGILNGHKVYSDIIKGKVRNVNTQQTFFFDKNDLADKVLRHMNDNHF